MRASLGEILAYSLTVVSNFFNWSIFFYSLMLLTVLMMHLRLLSALIWMNLASTLLKYSTIFCSNSYNSFTNVYLRAEIRLITFVFIYCSLWTSSKTALWASSAFKRDLRYSLMPLTSCSVCFSASQRGQISSYLRHLLSRQTMDSS